MRIKRLTFALIAAPLAILLLLGLWPSPKVRLAKETTYISAPLAGDGLPNYVLAILEKEKDGVTKENNGARQFWQAVGPGKLDQEHFEAICKELKIEHDSSRKSLVNVGDDEIAERLAEWIAKRGAPSDQAGANAFATVDR